MSVGGSGEEKRDGCRSAMAQEGLLRLTLFGLVAGVSGVLADPWMSPCYVSLRYYLLKCILVLHHIKGAQTAFDSSETKVQEFSILKG